MHYTRLFLVAGLLGLGCRPHYHNPVDTSVALDSSFFAGPKRLGQVEKKSLDEISGLAASFQFKDAFWVHNDSGGKNRLYLLSKTGQHLGELDLGDLKNRDWEDICVGQNKTTGQYYLYLGEIGDNQAKYKYKYIYRVPEPSPASVKFPFEKKAKKVKVMKFRLPDQVRDTETLMFDPLTHSLWLVSKREEKVRLYELPDFEDDTEGKAIFHQELPITYANGGDISPDGREILIKNYANIYYWPRLPSQTIAEALQRPPLRLPYQEEPQGEAIAWDSQGKGFYTVSEESEGIEAEMLFYARLKKGRP